MAIVLVEVPDIPTEPVRDNRGIVYTLHCPESGLVRYIGCTIYNDVRYRLNGHFARGQNMQSPVSLWVEQLAMEGMRPTWQTHGQYHYPVATKMELNWIQTFSKHLRGVLLNCTGRTDMKNSHAGRILRLQLAAERPLPPGYIPCPDYGVRYVPSRRIVHPTAAARHKGNFIPKGYFDTKPPHPVHAALSKLQQN